MSDTHTIELDSIWKKLSKGAGKLEGRAFCKIDDQLFESTGDYWNISFLCEEMYEKGVRGKVKVVRGTTPVFDEVDIEWWVGRRHMGLSKKPDYLRRT